MGIKNPWRGSQTPQANERLSGDGSGPVRPLPPDSRRLARRIILRIIPLELLLPVISKPDPPTNCISKLASFGLRHQLVRRVISHSTGRGSLIPVLSLSISLSRVCFRRPQIIRCAVIFHPVSCAWSIDNPEPPFDLIESPCHWTDSTSLTFLPPALYVLPILERDPCCELLCSSASANVARPTTPPSPRLRNPACLPSDRS